MARDGKCPCLSQTDDSIVFCQLAPDHDGLHHWQDPVHPGHSKLWAGAVTEPTTDTRWRFESAKTLGQRLGLVKTESGGVGYAPMMETPRELEETARGVELVSGES